LAEWRNTYPKLAHALDNAKLLGMLGDGSLPVSSPPPLEPVISSPMIAHDRKAQDKVVMTKPSALQAAIERANDFIRSDARNSDWTPFIAPLSDLKIPEMPFCIVPTGTFQMGADDLTFLETPVHAQTFEQPFYIAQYPVTNRQWAVGVSAGIVKEPQGRRALAWYNDRHMANAPVIGITWYEAQKFVTWVGCRLPTEREWEYAARGVENLTYPWGNKWDVTKPVWEGHSGGYPNDVTTKPTGASWVGAAHLSGNVWEWCGSAYGAYPYPTDGSREQEIVYRADVRYVLRGGSWNDGSKEMRSAYRSDYSPVSGSLIIGLRCARSL
jgi:formylglycine-generating enzyme required for sulfatase activity